VDTSIQTPTIDEEREAGRTVSFQLNIPWKNVSTTLRTNRNYVFKKKFHALMICLKS